MLNPTRGRGDGGASLLEAALTFPVVMAIILAVIEFGMLFSTTSTTTSATRDGARYATSVYAVRSDKIVVGDEIRAVVEDDLQALTGLGTPVRLWVYKADANGDPTGGPTCATNCLRYTWDTGSNEFVFDVGSSPWTIVDACTTVASPALDEIGVLVEVDHSLLTGVIGAGDRTIKEQTVLRLEPLPTLQCPA